MITANLNQTQTKALRSTALSVFIAFVLALLAGLVVPPLYADVYSWTDSDGVQHFSNVPPPPDSSSTIEVKRELVYDEAAGEERWKMEAEQWNALKQELTNTEKQEFPANETEAEKNDDSENKDEKIEREKFMLQSQIRRLERKPASSFSQQLNGKRASIAYYRSRLQLLEDDPERYFKEP